ncbi:MAG TPA: DUF2170 family protein [Pseudomonadales bacterium]|nr:DUF2170 family protein [Pseudomonadales bacterium]
MSAKSTQYQRALRERRRAQGLIKKEIWILPEHSSYLPAVEKAFRTKGAKIAMSVTIPAVEAAQRWTVESLNRALLQDEFVKSGDASVSLIAGAEQVLNVTMHGVGDLPVQVSISGEILVAQAILWERSLVKDVAAFHESVMMSEKMFELANISLDKLPNGTWVYVMYGSLRSTSSLEDIIFEVQTLAENVMEAAEAFREHLVV